MTKVGEHIILDIIGTTKEYDPSVFEKVINEIAKAATAFIEKCLKTVSWANIIPAIGAPKPAEIAAATPLPMIISCGILGIKDCFLINEDTVAPKCTKGP